MRLLSFLRAKRKRINVLEEMVTRIDERIEMIVDQLEALHGRGGDA